MIKVILPGRTLALKFYYTKENCIIGYDMDPAKKTPLARTVIDRVTKCQILEAVDDTINGKVVQSLRLVGHGRADCMPPDPFCKDTGRKIALRHAIEFMKLGRADRTTVWEAYQDRHNPERIIRSAGFTSAVTSPKQFIV